MNTQDYYRILGLEESAGLNEIKNAYRIKAKKYHPDVSKNTESIPLFIELTEAYQFLLEKLSREKKQKEFFSQDFEEYWQKQKREKAKQYAQRHAQMRFEQFQKSYIDQSAMLFFAIYDYHINWRINN